MYKWAGTPPLEIMAYVEGTFFFLYEGSWVVTLHYGAGYIAVMSLLAQGRRKQSPYGQARLDVGGKVINNSRAKRAAKI